ncbi:helix-turn-helix domain-containing protein [Cytophaga aurantiaca]|uniref:helix-turn-helix domain-containing protein n=1 Tax=Cytophaga aurantiaca TaxID=29530 RepID=UPI00036BBA80|nr:helix-turn-helix domain-containing protein [Cytophaga aurantiaca]
MNMRLQHIEPHPMLKAYIEKMWLFESSGKMPVEDLKLVVPNGNIKLSVAFRNGIVAAVNGRPFISKEQNISLTGLVDVPVILDAEDNVATGTIVVEFNPQGAYRFFRLSLNDIKNQIHSLTDILGTVAKQLEEQISNSERVEAKVALLQQFLLKQFALQSEDAVFEYCVAQITASKGRMTIQELEKKTGYSSRWLNMKFKEKLGVSPKNLSTIIRFNQYYNAVANNSEMDFMQNAFYDYYYDQSHFLKEFKRFTGISHAGFQYTTNDFGKLFYKE